MGEGKGKMKHGSPYYLVDGYNVILHSAFSAPSSRKTRNTESSVDDRRYFLLEDLSAYVRKKRVRVTVVWDGGASSGHPKSVTRNGVQSICTPPGMSADEQIVRMVEKRSNPREVTVISDDRRHIIGVVKNLGAQTMGVTQFLSLIGKKPGGGGDVVRRRGNSVDGGITSSEKKDADDLSVEEWLHIFKIKNSGNRTES
jgi:predicted RNA-binding protein with PIN domain